MIRKLSLVAVFIVVLPSMCNAGEGGNAHTVTFGVDHQSGVATTAHTFEPWVGGGTHSGTEGAAGNAGSAIQFVGNRCAFVSSGSIGNFVFSDSTLCTSFAAPAPPDPSDHSANQAQVINTLVQSATDKAMALAHAPRLAVSPRRVGLTGLETYLWIGNALRPVIATASVPGLSVTARATPTSFLWNFGEGQQRKTTNPGRAWTKRRPGNIGHTYETRGRYRISVVVTWTATWRVNGGAWRPLGSFTDSTARSYPVRQVVSRLVRSRP